MKLRLLTAGLTLAGCLYAQRFETLTRRATMTGNGGDRGKCTIEVDVDGSAEVAVNGDMGRLRTLSGQTATWRRFECNGMLPRNPVDFRFRGIDGRGSQTLVQDPRNSGAAVVRIDDPKGGREGYTFDLEWSGGSTFGNDRNDRYDRRDDRYDRRDDRYDRRDDRYDRRDDRRDDRYGRDNIGRSGAIRACREAIEDRIDRDGYTRVNIISADFDNNPGRNDYVLGRATAERRGRGFDFDFTCNMDFSTGRVRNVNINPRNR